jgi:hypothetical protein
METNKIIRALECDGEFQELTRKFVDQNVFYCVSHLVTELSKSGEYEELSECVYQYDSENEEDLIEALEHWLISDYLAEKLIEKGELVVKDFLGLTIWGRTTSGQSISLDHVIIEIMLESGFGSGLINRLLTKQELTVTLTSFN